MLDLSYDQLHSLVLVLLRDIERLEGKPKENPSGVYPSDYDTISNRCKELRKSVQGYVDRCKTAAEWILAHRDPRTQYQTLCPEANVTELFEIITASSSVIRDEEEA